MKTRSRLFRIMAAIAVAAPALALTVAPPATAADDYVQGEVWQLPDHAAYQLDYSATPRQTRANIDALARRHVITPSSVHSVLSDATDHLYPQDDDACATARPALTALADQQKIGAYCWGPEEQTGDWVPQGMTSTSDAAADSGYGPHNDQAVVVSWYSHRASPGLDRLSFVNEPDSTDDAPRYDNVVLAVPSGQGSHLTFTDLSLHAGGIGWYGHYLYVADTGNGFRVFDTDRIFRVRGDEDSLGIDPTTGQFSAHGARYVMFQAGRYDRVLQGEGDARQCDRTPSDIRQNYCFSAMSVDRSSGPASLISGEYRVKGDTQTDYENGEPTRLLRWPLDEQTGLMQTDRNGVVHASDAYGTWTERIQGVTSYRGTFYLSTSLSSNPGRLWTDRLDSAARLSLTAVGPEAVVTWRPDKIWSMTEHKDARWIFWMNAADLQP